MERRRTDADAVGGSHRPWEAVRRALGRLFARASVREVSAEQRTPAVRVQNSEAVAPPVPTTGAAESAWKPSARVSQAAIPQTEPGGKGQDLLPTVRLVAENYALAPPACRQMPPPVTADACRVASGGLRWPLEVARLPDAFLTLPSSPVLIGSRALLAAPSALALKPFGLPTPRSAAVRIPRLPAPRVRWGGDSVLSRMALTRRGREAPPGVPPELAFASERRRLAEAVGVPGADVTLLGVYPGVPILAVSRLVVEEEGQRLRLWLKPEVLRGRGSGRLITLLVGRRISDGKMLQAAL